MSVWNMARIGSMFGQPPTAASMGGIPGVELGRGSAVVAANANTTLDSAVVADGNAIMPAFPTQRTELSLGMFSANTNGGAANGTGVFMVQKDPVTLDLHNYQVRTFATAGARTFDWIWFRVPA